MLTVTLLSKKHASNEDWTHDLWFTRPTLCHWAIEAPAEWLPLTVQQNCVGDTRIWTMDLSDCSRLLYHWAISPRWLPTDKGQLIFAERPLIWGAACSTQRRWYNGQHSCLPSSWSGFDSRPTQYFFLLFGSQASRLCSRLSPKMLLLVNLKTKVFRYRELNPGHLGESQVS